MDHLSSEQIYCSQGSSILKEEKHDHECGQNLRAYQHIFAPLSDIFFIWRWFKIAQHIVSIRSRFSWSWQNKCDRLVNFNMQQSAIWAFSFFTLKQGWRALCLYSNIQKSNLDSAVSINIWNSAVLKLKLHYKRVQNLLTSLQELRRAKECISAPFVTLYKQINKIQEILGNA